MAHLLYKLMRPNMIHFDFEYIEGINEFQGRFDADAEKNGLFFCCFNDIPRWLHLSDDIEFVWKVDLLEDSKVYTYNHKMKTNKMRIRDPVPLLEFIEANFAADYLTECNVANLKFTMKEQRLLLDEISSREKYYLINAIMARRILMNDICLKCVQVDGTLLQYVIHQLPHICIAAINQNPRAFEFCKNGMEEIIELAIEKRGMNIMFVHKQTRDLCLKAVRQDGNALYGIKEQWEELCVEAVTQNPYAIIHVREQTPWIAIEAYKRNKDILGLLRDDLKAIIERDLCYKCEFN